MHPTWTEQWWPISYVQDLDPNQPSRFTLLERDLVIWLSLIHISEPTRPY